METTLSSAATANTPRPKPVARARPEPTISMDAPWRWLAAGWRDFLSVPVHSFTYGALVVGGGVFTIFALWATGLSSLIPVAFGVFALIGPIIAVGTYEISRRLDAGEPISFASIFFVKTQSPMQIAYIGFFLLFAVLAWVRIAVVIYALFASSSYMPLDDFLGFALSTQAGMAMLIVGTGVGALIAFSIYMLTIVSIPMLANEKTDLFTAIAAGVNAVRINTAPMILWAWLIAIITAAGVATFFFGLAIAFPVLGHASWRAYREIVGGVKA